MPTFPTINSSPVHYAHVEQLHADPTRRTAFESGAILTRLQATVSYIRYSVQYRGVSEADKIVLSAFQDTIGVGATAFDFTLSDDTVVSVRLAGPMQFRREPDAKTLWQVDFEIFGSAESLGETEYYSELCVNIPATTAGTDIADQPIFACPNPSTMKSVGILFTGSPAGVDDANTAVITIKNASGATVAAATFDTANQPPTDDYYSIDAALDIAVPAGDVWTLSTTCGAAASLAEMNVITTFYVTAAT